MVSIRLLCDKLRNYGNERKVRILAADSGGSVTSTVFTERLVAWRALKAHAEEPSHEAMDDTRALFRPEEALLFTAYPDRVRHR